MKAPIVCAIIKLGIVENPKFSNPNMIGVKTSVENCQRKKYKILSLDIFKMILLSNWFIKLCFLHLYFSFFILFIKLCSKSDMDHHSSNLRALVGFKLYSGNALQSFSMYCVK